MFIQKRTIAIFTVLSTAFYIPSIVFAVLSIMAFFPSSFDFYSFWSGWRQGIIWLLLSYLVGLIGCGLSITAYVGAVIRQVRLQQWAWLICTLVFGCILGFGALISGFGALGFFPLVVLIYLLAVPDVPPSALQNPHRFPPLAQFIPPQQYPPMLPQQYQQYPPIPFQQYPPQQYQPVPLQQYPPQQYPPIPFQQYPPQQYQPVPPQQGQPRQYQPVPPQKEEDEEKEELL